MRWRQAFLLMLVPMVVLAGCGESVDYNEAKQQAGPETKEYLLQVRGMT